LEGVINQTNTLIRKSVGLINQAPTDTLGPYIDNQWLGFINQINTLMKNETFSKRNTYLINEFSLEIFIFCDNYKYQ